VTIRYFLDGISEVSYDEEVVCQGAHGFYIKSSPLSLKYVPHDFVVSKAYSDHLDNPKSLNEFITSGEIKRIKGVDYSLCDIFEAVH